MFFFDLLVSIADMRQHQTLILAERITFIGAHGVIDSGERLRCNPYCHHIPLKEQSPANRAL
jgi:hypothetical protein